jgi:hypothetical protein
MTKHVIEVLYTERCEYVQIAVERVRHALSRVGRNVELEVRLILVGTFGEAVTRRFRGSPTIRVDGRDVETREGAMPPIGLLPRGYFVSGYIERAPTQAAIERALGRLLDARPGLARSDRFVAAAPVVADHAVAGIEK